MSARPVPVRIAPSILSADFAALGRDIAAAERGGADLIHVDVMDGHFVPNITIGPPVVRAIKRIATRPLDVHLMIEEPDRYIESFVAAGAAMLSVHVEAVPHLHRTVALIRSLGAKAGVVINPATPVTSAFMPGTTRRQGAPSTGPARALEGGTDGRCGRARRGRCARGRPAPPARRA